jgi:glycosyltransferase involved in cell wall biosynthesis
MLGAETVDYSVYDKSFTGKYFRRLETQLRSDVYLATISWLKGRDYPLIFAWSERAGIPLAGYRRFFPSRNRFVTMFQCWSERQEMVIKALRLFSKMDDILVHCTSMQENLIRLGAQKEKVKLVRYSIDQNYFRPLPEIQQEKGLIMSVGESRSRNYPALFQAIEGLPVKLMLPAFGHWYAREKNKFVSVPPPENVVLLKHMPQYQLRDLYARSQLVVLPVHDLVYSAGATAALEAGCMARAVVAFRSRGITDYVIDGQTGILVEPGNVAALRDAIQHLLDNPAEAKRLGDNARQRIVEELNLEKYVNCIADILMQN